MPRQQLVVVAVLVGLAAGCGGGTTSNGEAKKAATQVVADATNAASTATSVHVSGAIVSGGQPLHLDLELVKGTGGKGTMAQSSLRFDLIRIGDTTYIRGSDAFLERFAGHAARVALHGKWLKAPSATPAFAQLTPLTDIGQLFTSSLAAHGKLDNRGETDYRGRKVVAIVDTTNGSTLYVAASGTPYPVAIAGGKGKGTIGFDGWNEPATIAAPKQSVDLTKLGN